MNIDEMKPGRVMNVRVAEDVMGWNMVRRRIYDDVATEDDYREAAYTDRWIWNTDKGCFSTREWNPSYEIADAWKVLLRLRELGFSYRIYAIDEQAGVGCNLWGGPADNYWFAYSESGLFIDALTAELAICRAALKVVNAGKKSRECTG